MAVMAWFKKERKPRVATRERREVPADAWEKCESCGHIDIREKFEKAFNVCPECGTHKRFFAEEYIDLLSDEGSWREMYANLRSEDPLTFEHYPDRLAANIKKAGSSDAIFAGAAKLEGMPVHLGVMNFRFMGGSMGSVVGEKIASTNDPPCEKNGSGMPVIGISEIVIPIFSKICVKSRPTDPATISDANGSLVFRAMRTSTSNSPKKRASEMKTPMNPSSSPTTAKTKSVPCSGMYPDRFWVPRVKPLPVHPPEPIATLEWKAW